MRLFKTYSHTSERRGDEADKERQVKREIKEAYPKRRKNVDENNRHVNWKGERGENVSTEKRKSKVAPPPRRGGARRNYTTEKENNHIVLWNSRRGKITQNPSAPRGRIDRTKKKRTSKTYSPVPQLSGPITQTMARH